MFNEGAFVYGIVGKKLTALVTIKNTKPEVNLPGALEGEKQDVVECASKHWADARRCLRKCPA